MVSHDRLLEALHYDGETGLFVWIISGGPRSVGKIAGRINEDGYREIGLDGGLYKAHRLAWFYAYREWPAGRLDHEDGNRDNNRIANLRVATGQQNAANRRISGRSGVKGVFKRGNRFIAGIKVNGRRIHLGSFGSKDEAADAYERAATHHFGAFASNWIAPEILNGGRREA